MGAQAAWFAMLQGPSKVADEEEEPAYRAPPADVAEGTKGCKDPLFALGFLAAVGWLVSMIVVNHQGVAAEWKSEVGDAQASLSILRASESLGWCFLTAVIFSGIWLSFMRYC